MYYSKTTSIDLEIHPKASTSIESINVPLRVILLNQTAIEFLSKMGEKSIVELEKYGRSYTFHGERISIDITSDVFAIILYNPNTFEISVTLIQRNYGLRPPSLTSLLITVIFGLLFILFSYYHMSRY
jgi:hypothetical protein